MGWLGRFRQWLGKDKVHIDPLRPGVPHPHRLEEEPEEISVEEVAVEELREALTHAGAPLVLDVREPYEWRQVRMPGALHIPMNSVPDQLERLPRERPVVVVCAHGNRSYGVAAWLMEQGYHAASLRGGITQWARHGGHIEQGAPAVE